MHFSHSSDQFTSRVRILNYISLYSCNLWLIQTQMIGNFQLRGDKSFVHSGEKVKKIITSILMHYTKNKANWNEFLGRNQWSAWIKFKPSAVTLLLPNQFDRSQPSLNRLTSFSNTQVKIKIHLDHLQWRPVNP